MDLDGDGQRDLLSGSWPGELYFFRGNPDAEGGFEKPEMIRDKVGAIINVEGGVKKQPDGMILITGHAEWESDVNSGKHFVTYQGKKYESTPQTPVATTGCAAHLHAADWDADGDLDLLVGTIGGSIYLVTNEGSATEWAFGKKQRLKAGKLEISGDGDAAPFCIDWDGDGDLDLFSGGDSGAVRFFENTGTEQKPELAKAKEVISEGLMAYGDDAPEDVVRGGRSKICVTDWNEDGRLDILVGDVSYQRREADDLPPEEAKQMQAAKVELEKLHRAFGDLIQKIHGPNRVKTVEEQKAVQEQIQALQEKMAPLQDLVPEETATHGSVWLFQQKSPR